jgi:hypothetical protein
MLLDAPPDVRPLFSYWEAGLGWKGGARVTSQSRDPAHPLFSSQAVSTPQQPALTQTTE